MPTPEHLFAAALIITGAYVVFGITGFGSTVLALPLLAHLMPLKFVVPLMMLLDLCMTLLAGVRLRRGIRFDELAWLAPFMLIGMGIGLTLLISIAESKLLLALGVFVLVYAAYGMLRRGGAPALARAWCAPIGLVGGALSALFGTGGVLFAIYTSGRIRDKDQLRATTASTIMLTALVRVVLFGAAGLLAQDGLLLSALLLAPAALAGFAIGNRLQQKIPAAAVVRVMYALLVLAGASLLVRALG